ncbi:cobaltochelatase subunit CobN [Nannocystaceae bacterium ST9]
MILALAALVVAALVVWRLRAPASEPASAAEPARSARVAFVGVWEAAIPGLLAAGEREGIAVEVESLAEFNELPVETLAGYDLVLLLNVEPERALLLQQRLREARDANPEQRVIALDQRDGQAGLEKAELLERDEEVQRYWRYGGVANFHGLLGYLDVEYLGGEGPVQTPQVVPQSGLYHPDHEGVFEDVASYRAWYAQRPDHHAEAPWVVFLVHQRFVFLDDTALVDALIAALEARNLNVATLFADKVDEGHAMIGACDPSAILTLRHTPIGRQADGTPQAPARFDVPYLKPIGLLGQTVEEWQTDRHGLVARDLGLQVVVQELDGAIETLVVGGLVAHTGGYRLQAPIPERIERFADRVAAQLRLRSRPNADKRIAIIYYNKYLGRSDLGRGSPTGAFLNGPRSLVAVLAAMQARGYAIHGAPQTEDELLARMSAEGRNLGVWAQGEIAALVRDHDPVLIPLATYERWFTTKLSAANQQAVIDAFGPPPGELMVHEQDGQRFVVIPRIDLGNVILAPQPDRGPNQDEDLVHSSAVPPPHQYLAFYWWLHEEFHADAIVHFGTHGSMELLPTKATGLSGEDWPDITIGAVPHVYPWILDNLAEAMIAKRRAYALLIGHLVPPIAAVGLVREMKSLHDDIDEFETLEPGLLREEYRATISSQAVALDLHVDVAPEAGERPFTDDEIDALADYLHEAHNERTPLTLHVFGQVPERALLGPYLVQMLGDEFLDHLAAQTRPIPAEDVDVPVRRKAVLVQRAEALLEAIVVEGLTDEQALGARPEPPLAEDLARARELLAKLERSGDETENFLRALEGRYIQPGPGNDPIRNPAALPTGRNLYALDPAAIPTEPAWRTAQTLVDQLLTASLAKDGRYPRKVGFDLNGFETMRNFGVDEGQVLYLPGCRPIWDENRNVVDVELISRAELGRPRIDVFVATSGTYRDNFPTRMELIDRCIRMAVDDPEPSENFVREGSEAMALTLRAAGHAPEVADDLSRARVFGQPPGQYGTQILHLIPRGGVWDSRDEITQVYRENMSYVYTRGAWGEQREGLYDAALTGTETIVRSWSSNMMSPLSNHHVYEYLGGLSMAVAASNGGKEPRAWIADVRNPNGVEMRDFREVLRMDYRTQMFNEVWIRGMMANGYAGAGQMAELTKNTFGWSVTRPSDVDKYIWDQIAAIYVQDEYELGLREWFAAENPHALQEMAATLLEAHRKGMWAADAETLAAVAKLYVESVAEHGASAGLVTGGNQALEQHVQGIFEAPGTTIPAEAFAAYQAELARSRGTPKPATPRPSAPAPRPEPEPSASEVEGQTMETVEDEAAAESSARGRRWLAWLGLLGLFLVGVVARALARRRDREVG